MPRGGFPPKDKLIMKDLLFRYSELPLAGFLTEAARTKDRLIKYRLSPITERLMSDLKDKGIFVSPSFNHVLDNYAIRHILMKHANEKEILRGQILVQLEDFLLLPEIVSSYDQISLESRDGKTILAYCKSFADSTDYYFEELRSGRLELAAVTFYKRKRKLTDANS